MDDSVEKWHFPDYNKSRWQQSGLRKESYHGSFSGIVISKLKRKVWYCLCDAFYTHLLIICEPVILQDTE